MAHPNAGEGQRIPFESVNLKRPLTLPPSPARRSALRHIWPDCGLDPLGALDAQDVQQLWRRVLFNLLINNVDDPLQNHGFLHVLRGLWRLAPAFDINPFPDKDRDSKT
ncbi:MAG: HipA domain-containing protein [Thioalkalivibrio sp.]|nr:HipA domain-containing protein [Thioalkalivibrio sp.]